MSRSPTTQTSPEIARTAWLPGTRARAAVLAAALLFSTGGTAIKATSITGLEVAGARSGIAALVLLLTMPKWRGWWRLRPLVVGVAYGATMTGFVVANKLTLAANAIFLQSTAPLYVLVFAPLVLGERNRRPDLLLTPVLLAGMSLFFLGSSAESATAPNPGLGNWVAIGTGITWAMTLVGLRSLSRGGQVGGRDDAGAAVIAGNMIGFVACAPFMSPLDGGWSGADVLIVSYLGVFQIGLAYVLMTRGVRNLRALEVSLLILVEPVLGSVFAWAILDERPGALALTGCVLILAATLVRVLVGRER